MIPSLDNIALPSPRREVARTQNGRGGMPLFNQVPTRLRQRVNDRSFLAPILDGAPVPYSPRRRRSTTPLATGLRPLLRRAPKPGDSGTGYPAPTGRRHGRHHEDTVPLGRVGVSHPANRRCHPWPSPTSATTNSSTEPLPCRVTVADIIPTTPTSGRPAVPPPLARRQGVRPRRVPAPRDSAWT